MPNFSAKQIRRVEEYLSGTGLNKKQQNFLLEYLGKTEPNATDAYISAGYKARGSAARANASRLLSNDNIQKSMKEVQNILDSEKIAGVQEVMEYLTSVMRREKKENVVVTLSEETSKYVPDPKGTMRKQTEKKEIPQVVEIPAKLSDANKAAELLGRRYSLFTDKLDVDMQVDLADILKEAWEQKAETEK